MVYENLAQILEANTAETIAWRRHLHQYPELSFQEEQTRAYIVSCLKAMGFAQEDILLHVGEGGVVAKIETGKPGTVIALRADFDALPIEEETDFPFRSQHPGVMHACGHDAHTAILLSVAKAAKAQAAELNGTLYFVFQHAEELPPGGAQAIMASGVLKDVDVMFGLHVQGSTPFTDKIAINSGYVMAAADQFEILVEGKGGHGAAPHTTVDSAVVGAFLIAELQTIISRKLNPVEAGVLTVSGFQAGEGAANVIADKAYIRGTVRTLLPEVRSLIEQELHTIAKHVALAHGAKATVTYSKGYPAVHNHPKETELLKQLFSAEFGAEQVVVDPPVMGGEDFAYYLETIPGSFFYIPAGITTAEIHYPHHHPKFALDEQSLLTGGKAFARILAHYN